jgi:glycine/D-amino acid oxidase-like deaminating enzyme
MHDCIIVGAGIAGMVTARILHDAGYDVAIIDNARKGSASIVAAGLINPVTGKRFEPSWRYDEFISKARQFYTECEHRDHASVYFRNYPMLRIFANEKECETFEKKYTPEHLGRYVGEQFGPEDSSIHHSIKNLYGGFRTLDAGIFNYVHFLTTMSQKFSTAMSNGFIDQHNLSRNYDTWSIALTNKVLQSQYIIFCDGWQGSVNPWLADLGLKYDIVKGESCIIQTRKLPETDIISRGFAIIPIGNHTFRCAATFQWNEMHTIPTAFGAERLQDRIQSLINCEYEILEQSAGLRPTMFEHKPFIGEHPKYSGLFAIGGLGTKGALYAPYMAYNLLDYLNGTGEIDPEMNLLTAFNDA